MDEKTIIPCQIGPNGRPEGMDITGNPFFLLTFLLIMIGFQFIATGLLGEINVRTYYESQNKRIYVIRETFEGGREADERQ